MSKKRRLQVLLLVFLTIPVIYFILEKNFYGNHMYSRYMKKTEKNRILPSVWKSGVNYLTSATFNQSGQGRPKGKVVLILAYMHTGSTFLGSILQQVPGSYYEYESLRSLQYDTRNNITVVYMNGSVRQPNGKYIDVSMATDAVSKMITCNHGQLDMSTLSRSHYGLDKPPMRDVAAYCKCIHVEKRREYPFFRQLRANTTGHFKTPLSQNADQSKPPTRFLRSIIQTCLPLLTGKCENAHLRSIKFIRMSMEVAGNLLKTFPDTKIIHLTRDPRAMLDSQVRRNDMGSRQFDSFVKNAASMCSRLKRDHDLLHILKPSYPGSFYSMQYEKLVQSPIEETEKMMGFLGIEFTEKLKNFVLDNTIYAARKSTERAAVWRQHISVQHLNVLDSTCQKVYTELGYIKYSSILDIQNLSKPTFLSEEG